MGWLRRGSEESSYAPRSDPNLQPEPERERDRFDARVGVGVTLGPLDWQLAWDMNDGEVASYSDYGGHGDDAGWVLSVAHEW